jgi:hypothetical protein
MGPPESTPNPSFAGITKLKHLLSTRSHYCSGVTLFEGSERAWHRQLHVCVGSKVKAPLAATISRIAAVPFFSLAEEVLAAVSAVSEFDA